MRAFQAPKFNTNQRLSTDYNDKLSFDAPLKSSHTQIMKTTITRKQRMIIALYTACFASLATLASLVYDILPFSLISSLIFGYVILPGFISTQQFTPKQALSGGVITTLAITLLTGISFGILLFTNSVLYEGIVPETGLEITWLISTYSHALLNHIQGSLMAFIPLSIIGGPAAILLAYLLHRHHQKYPPIDKAAFE
ncbi:hypothetical protein [Kiloniella antarctica]|uniref:HPP family protein n=1 Tax=Kiloniella antarctica TaxID=1550907 RepID=A0ABW5BJU8_9PROT